MNTIIITTIVITTITTLLLCITTEAPYGLKAYPPVFGFGGYVAFETRALH
jgi:hypothetical protein